MHVELFSRFNEIQKCKRVIADKCTVEEWRTTNFTASLLVEKEMTSDIVNNKKNL